MLTPTITYLGISVAQFQW